MKVALLIEIFNNEVNIRTQIDYKHLRIESGKTETLETLLTGYFKDVRLGKEFLADVVVKQQNIKLKLRSAVYCTRYAGKNGSTGSEQSTINSDRRVKWQAIFKK